MKCKKERCKWTGITDVSILLSLFFLLLSKETYAATSFYTETFESILSFIFVDLQTDKGLKLLFTLFLFVLLFGFSQIALGKFAQNIRLFLSCILAIISTMSVPIDALKAIAIAYGVFFSTLLVGVPAVGGAYILFGVFEGEDMLSYIIKSVLSFILAWFLLSFGWGVP